MINKIIYSIVAALLISMIAPLAAVAGDQALIGSNQSRGQNDTLAKTQQELNLLALKIQDKQNELQNLSDQLEKSSREIIAIYQKLTLAQRDLDEEQSILNNRIREIYKNNDNNNFLSVLVTSSSLGDLWTRISFLARVNQIDREILSENNQRLEKVQGLKRDIAAKKNSQIDQRNQKTMELAELKRSYLNKQSELENLASLPKAGQQQSTYVSDFTPSKY